MNSLGVASVTPMIFKGDLMKTLLVVDGNSIINRAFYGVKPLTNKNGQQTGAVFGMLNIILSHL